MKFKLHLPWPDRAAGRRMHMAALWTRALMVLVLITTLTSQTAFSQEAPNNPNSPMPTWTKVPVDAPPYFADMTDRSLAYNPITSEPCVAYGGDALYYSCRNAYTGQWVPQIVDYDVQVGRYAAMTINLQPAFVQPIITYYDSENARLKVAIATMGGWDIRVVPNVPNILPDGSPVVPVSRQGENLERSTAAEAAAEGEDKIDILGSVRDFFSSWLQIEPELDPSEGPDYQRPMIDFESVGYGKFPSVDVDESNGIHISYHDEVMGALEYQYFDGENWYGTVVDDYHDQGDAGLWSSIAVDPVFNVHIAYMSEKYDDLKWAMRRSSNNEWVVATLDSANNVGSFSSIALDKDFLPHISYYDFSTDNLKHTWRAANGSWTRETVDGNGLVGWYTSIAIDYSNRVHISYYDVTHGDLKYARRDGASSWSIAKLDNTGKTQNLGLFTSIAIDPSGNVGVFYTNATLGVLKYIHKIKNLWSLPSYVHYYSRDVGLATSLAIDNAGIPYISYLDASGGYLKWARPYAQTWFTSPVLTYPHSGLYSSIAIGSNNVPHIAFYDHDFGDLMYSTWTWPFWTYGDLDRTFHVGQYTALAMDSQNLPHISYYDVTHKDLLYASWNVLQSRWYTQTIDYVNTVGWYSDIAVGPSDIPYISYYDASNGSLKVARRSPLTQTWIYRTVENIGLLAEAGVGAYTSIGIDNTGRPHITYYDITHQDLKYAYFEGDWAGVGSWNISVIDPGGNAGLDDVGRFSSLAIYTPDNTRHVCYYDYTNGNLWYARWEGAGPWQKMMVDGAAGAPPAGDGDAVNEGDVGLFCSIDVSTDVDSAGKPVISYYDNSHGDLKVALSYTLPDAELFLPLLFKP